MNILMIGNGFDINYSLPTKYIDFLNTVQFLSEKQHSSIKTIGDIFGDLILQTRNETIRKSSNFIMISTIN